MKSNAKSPLYFSAYPLKAISEPPSPTATNGQTPYLRAILAGKSKASSRVRVFPMADPYPKKSNLPKRIRLKKQVDPNGEGWYNHYE